MKKKVELFYFFEITNPAQFKQKLATDIHSRITTTTQLLDVSKQPSAAVNLAFSQRGLNAINVTESLGDSAFTAGQASVANTLGDPGTTNWVSAFTGTNVHGVFLLASDSVVNILEELGQIQSVLNGCASEVYSLPGTARPGDQEGHERTSIS